MIIRVLTFEPAAAGEVTDTFLRSTLLPGLLEQPGLQHAHFGRGGDEAGRRIVVTVWQDELLEPSALSRLFPFESGQPVAEPLIEAYPATVAFSFAPPEGAQILRVFRGRTKPGQTEAYLDALRDGTQQDVAEGRGPLALFLGLRGQDAFVTVSVWSSWQRIEAATGGNIRQPIATQHNDLLVEGTAEHFEIVPNTAVVQANDAGAPAQLATTGLASSSG